MTGIDILLLSIGLFFISLISIRLMGKLNLARATPFQFVSYAVIAITIASISTNMLPNIVFGFIALFVWVGLTIALQYLALKSQLVHHWLNGEQVVLVKEGKIMEENLSHIRITGEDLLSSLRAKNAFSIGDVEFAVLEPTGEVNVLLKSDKKPVTSHDLQWPVAPQAEPQTVILDGNILNESLTNRGLNQEWLNTQLESMGVSLDNVFVGQVDTAGDLYVDLFDDALQLPQATVKEMVYANMQKCQADLVTYSLETEDPQAKAMYADNAQRLEDVMNRLKTFLLS